MSFSDVELFNLGFSMNGFKIICRDHGFHKSESQGNVGIEIKVNVFVLTINGVY